MKNLYLYKMNKKFDKEDKSYAFGTIDEVGGDFIIIKQDDLISKCKHYSDEFDDIEIIK